MLWERKMRSIAPDKPELAPVPPAAPKLGIPTETAKLDNPMMDKTQKVVASSSPIVSANQTILGRSVVLRGDLSGNEDVVIEGQFEGSLDVQDHSVTVGPQGQVKSEIHARQVTVHGSVNGKISARDKIEIFKTGNVVGDLITSGVVIEDGAYFKGSIEIVRDGKQEVPRARAASADRHSKSTDDSKTASQQSAFVSQQSTLGNP